MKINRIGVIVGTRPQIIKSQPVIKSLKKDGFKVDIIHSGQHYDYQLSKKFFEELKIDNPTINLGVGPGTSLEQISKIILKLEKFFDKVKPDIVIIPGDTTSALGSAIAASKCRIKIAHLEAGARSNQFYMSEEINRRLVDHCSDFLFAPTKNCLKNLKNESVYGKSFFVGDTMYDLFLEERKKHSINFKESKYDDKILVTIHRAENIENKNNLKKVCNLINLLSKSGRKVIFPIHPHTKKRITSSGFKINATTTTPLGYIDMMKLLSETSLVVTDSGGLQKEAYWSGTPCITLRESTEWIETVNEKANFLFPLSKPINLKLIEKISSVKVKPKKILFGNGVAAEKISSIIKKI